MPTGFGLNRGRLQLTGLEEPEELWERLKEATAEAHAQAATNKKLVARLQMLERQLSEVGVLTDDELVAELPKRMTRALESAQAVAEEIVGRARKQEAAIRKEASESAADIVRQAERQAASMLSDAATQASAHIVSAEGNAQEIVRAAQARRREVLTGLSTEAESLQKRIEVLQWNQTRLLDVYEVVETTLAEARRALTNGSSEPSAASPEPAAPNRKRVSGPPGTRTRARSGPETVKVYDWSPATTSAG